MLLPLLSVQLPVRPLFVKFFLCESTKITNIQSESLLFQPKTWGNLHTPRLFWRCHAYYYNLHQVRIFHFIRFLSIAFSLVTSCLCQFLYMILVFSYLHLILLNFILINGKIIAKGFLSFTFSEIKCRYLKSYTTKKRWKKV